MFGSGKFWKVLCCGGALSLCVLLAPAQGVDLSSEEQERKALEIRLAVSRLSEDRAEEREALYHELVKLCPATEAAEEALWALSGLYLDAFDEPREQSAREVLELFLARYPDSKWGVQVRSRLILLYSGTENRKRVAELCRELLGQRVEELPDSYRPFLALTEADAWREAGETEKAKEAYTRVVREHPGTPQAARAGERLADLKPARKKGQ